MDDIDQALRDLPERERVAAKAPTPLDSFLQAMLAGGKATLDRLKADEEDAGS